MWWRLHDAGLFGAGVLTCSGPEQQAMWAWLRKSVHDTRVTLLSINEATATKSCSLRDGVAFCAQEMLLTRLKGKGHSKTSHRMHREGVKVYLHSLLSWAQDGRGWYTPHPGKKPQDISLGAPQIRSGRAWRTDYLAPHRGLDCTARSEWKTV